MMTAGIGGFRHRSLPRLLRRQLTPLLNQPVGLGANTDRERRLTKIDASAKRPWRTGPDWSQQQWGRIADRTYRADILGADFDIVRFERHGSQLDVVIHDKGGRHLVSCGTGRWHESLTSVTSWWLHHNYQPKEARVVANATWTAEDELRLVWNFIESPFCDQIIVRLNGDALAWTRSVSANSGATERAVVRSTHCLD